MLEMLLDILKNSGVHAWEIEDVTKEGWEFYFIRHSLDQNRAKNVRHITVKVYQLIDEGKGMGSAAAELAPTATEQEARKLVENLAYQATLAPNRPYPLVKPTPAHASIAPGEAADVPAIARQFMETMASLPETEGEDVNSYEIFASSVTRRFLNSEGVDVTEIYPSSMIEVVVNARAGDHEIELYRLYDSGSCDGEGLKRDLTRAMTFGRDRLRAVPTPRLGKADVIFSTDDACNIYSYFVIRMDPALVLRRMSDWQIGEPIARDVEGDRVTVKAVRELPNSSENHAIDPEGAPIRDEVMIEDGVAKHYLGGRMFASYMGLEDAFRPGNIEVTGGTRTAQALRQGRYLEVVEFSDFQVDPMTGDIFGEIRLAYLHDGQTVTPVSGGSISGSMGDFVKRMYMSRELTQYDSFRIPAVTLLKDVTVTGIA